MIFKVIANPVAGRGRTKAALPNLELELNNLGIAYELYLTKEPGHASILAKQAEGYNGIIAVGGDGTINEIVNGMPKNKPLCIVPLGTGNDLARSLNIPFGIESLKTLVSGNIVKIDLGIEQDGVFACSVALGLATDVMLKVNANRNHRLIRGSLAINLSIVSSAFSLKPLKLRIKADNKVREVESILTYVMNTPYTGGGLFLAPGANATDGLLDVVIVNDIRGWELLKMLPKVYSGKHVNHPKVEFLKAKNVTIESLEPAEKMCDGEIKGHTPLISEIHTEKLPVYVPA
jgi:diacylglycerol kinase (ATP)